MELFMRLNAERGITMLIVTHEADIAAFTQRTITIRNGQIVHDGPSPQHDLPTRSLARQIAPV